MYITQRTLPPDYPHQTAGTLLTQQVHCHLTAHITQQAHCHLITHIVCKAGHDIKGTPFQGVLKFCAWGKLQEMKEIPGTQNEGTKPPKENA